MTRLAQAALTLLASPSSGRSAKTFAAHDGAEDVRTRGRELLWQGEHIHRLLSLANAHRSQTGSERDFKADAIGKGGYDGKTVTPSRA